MECTHFTQPDLDCEKFVIETFFFKLLDPLLLNPFHIGVFNKPKGLGGGTDLPHSPPWLYGYRRVFSLFFSYRDLVLDVKDIIPIVQPSKPSEFFEKLTFLATIQQNRKFAI